jgi:tetratricopeptide (TPR) repeat protein
MIKTNFFSKFQTALLTIPGNRYSAVWYSLLMIGCGILLLFMSLNMITIPSPYLATLLTFYLIMIMPGELLFNLFSRDRMALRERLAVSFVLSLGLWSIPAAILLITGSNLEVMKYIVVTITLGLGVLSSFHVIKDSKDIKKSNTTEISHEKAGEFSLTTDFSHPIAKATLEVLFWLSILLLAFTFVYFSNMWRYGDRWEYAGIVQYYRDIVHFGVKGIFASGDLSPRMRLSVWFVQQALVNKIAGINLLDMYSFYLPPVLVVISCLATYTFFTNVLQNRTTAKFAVLLQTVYYFSDIIRSNASGLGFFQKLGMGQGADGTGTMIFLRIIEDKFLLVLIVMPIVLVYLMKYITLGSSNYAILLMVTMAAAILVHPLGIVYLGLTFSAFILINYIIEPQKTKNFRIIVVIVFLLIGTSIPLYLKSQFSSVPQGSDLFRLDKQNPDYLGNEQTPESLSLLLVSAKNEWYMAAPNLITRRVLLVLGLLSLPALIMIYGLRRPGIQLLLSTILIPLVSAFNPVIAPVLAKFISPDMLWRIYLLMPIPAIAVLAAVLTGALDWFIRHSQNNNIIQYKSFLLVTMVLLIAAALRPDIVAGINLMKDLHDTGLYTEEVNMFRYLSENAVPGSTILTPPNHSDFIPAFVGRSQALTFRGIPTPIYGVQIEFYESQFVENWHIDFIKSHNIRYIVMFKDSALDLQFASFYPQFIQIYTNSQFSVYSYASDLQREYINVIDHLIRGNELFKSAKYEQAIAEYQGALALDSKNIWANIMIGDIYFAQNDISKAIAFYEQIAGNISSSRLHLSLGDAYRKIERFEEAKIQYNYLVKQPQYMQLPRIIQPPQLEQPQYLQLSQVRLTQVAGDIYQAAGRLKQAVNAYRWATSLGMCDIPAIVPRKIYLPFTWLRESSGQQISPQHWADQCSKSISPIGNTDSVVTYEFIENFKKALDEQSISDPLLKTGVFTNSGDPRAVLFQHPTSQVSFTILPFQNSTLMFSTSLSPEVWHLGLGDGVQFDIYINSGNTKWHIFSEYIDPKNIPDDRRWHDHAIDLSPWANQPVTITYATGPGPNNDNRFDWAGWGEPRIVQPIAYDFLAKLPNADFSGADKKQVGQKTITIDYEPRAILFQHPTNRIAYRTTIPKQARLFFGLGLDPSVWSPEKGDGVEYNIYIRRPEEPNKLFWVFQHYIDPKNNSADRRWFDEQVDLNQFTGETVDIIFEALPGPSGDPSFDWGGWSTPVLVAGG